ncbi:MAG: efflux RND transporter periplasmic adaptor subunit [Candidatus Manganitrophus sp.]|nr:efflux RND transporter periplasmic adaptor subunit [Candidatus Manganitrophus sp.]WDT71164.1 MAG: efflux RND transporter periplasmic adaptor subunit [Candidatus Manganitrophus sp.]WDT81539.1 MAG: efflux RND transporter periplasmic adaptor subunit [Candidatus Manganitrophus sp.]
MLITAIGVVIGLRAFSGAAKSVEVATVSSLDPSQSVPFLNASGYVVAQRRAAVASKGTGRLVELRVREGDLVKKGELIGRLESDDMEAALARARANLNVARSAEDQAKAALDNATSDYERKKSLLEEGLVPRADFDAAEAQYRGAKAALASAAAGVKAAEAAVRSAEVEVENTVIRAPFDGTVLTKNAEVGEVVAPFGSSTQAKAAVVTMADMSSLQVEADVSESNIEKVRVGQAAEIALDAYPETKYEGVVQTVVPTADRAKATVLTKIRFLNLDDRVLPEMSAKVAFLADPKADQGGAPIVTVNPGAIVTREDRKVAFRIREEHVEMIPVETGGSFGSQVEVKQGLKPGDRVVLNPPENLAPGDRVQVQ